ncbi:solute carrier family 49 member A3-like isoform X2 [Dysidea avara]|uniref:solute carrier family 49 member A3-like isoform X2 n=1 Tax=Dysidea avara TaxID=196820 RepID=UPI00331D1035
MTSDQRIIKCNVDMQQKQDNATQPPLEDSAQASTSSSTVSSYRVYKRRWYILATCSLLNFSNGMLWLTFAAIPNETAEFYHISLQQVDWFSITYFIIGFAFGFVGIMVIDDVGLRFAIILGAVLNAIGAILRYLSTLEFVLDYHIQHSGYWVALIGQVLCATSQPFVYYSPTKLAAFWFSGKERTFATMCSSMARPLGFAVLFLISPHIVNSELQSSIPKLLLATAVLAVVGCAMALFGFCSSRPPTPPAPSAERKTEPVYKGITKILQNKTYLVLLLVFGINVGQFTSQMLLIPQMLCPYGYSESLSGLWVASWIFTGLVGAVIVSILADRTKYFEEIFKMLNAFMVLTLIWFVLMVRMQDQEVLITISICLLGLFAFPQSPAALEMGVEVTYPAPEATSTGLLWIMASVTGDRSSPSHTITLTV